MTDDLDIEALLEAPFRKKGNEAVKSGDRGHERNVSKDYELEKKYDREYSRDREYGRDRDYKRDREHRDHRRGREFERDSRVENKRYSRSRSPSRFATRRPSNSPSREDPVTTLEIHTSLLSEAQRDRRTVFCRQLAQRLESRELREFCEQAGRVRDVRIVFDKISRRSKGVAYVEFYEEEAVPTAVALSGRKLLGIPIIVELTETEKNRIAEEAAQALRMEKLAQKPTSVYLAVTNLHPSITEHDLKSVFRPFGDLTAVMMDVGRASATMVFRDSNDAKQACEKMSGFELAGRPISVQLKEGNMSNVGTEESQRNLVDRHDDDLSLEEPDVTDILLRSAREASTLKGMASTRPSPCVLLQHMYDPTIETAPDWEVEIAEEVQEECSKFGRVEHLHVARTADGDVFARFASTDSAQAAVSSLGGRWFGGKQVAALFLPMESYLHNYPREQ